MTIHFDFDYILLYIYLKCLFNQICNITLHKLRYANGAPYKQLLNASKNRKICVRFSEFLSEFLSDNANKDNTGPCAPSSPDAEKTSNLSPHVEKVPLRLKSVSEAEGTAKKLWSVVKPNTTSTFPVEPQNPRDFTEVACKSKAKSGEKLNKTIMTPKLSLHSFECWQINLHRSKEASYIMCKATKNVRSGLALAQEP